MAAHAPTERLWQFAPGGIVPPMIPTRRLVPIAALLIVAGCASPTRNHVAVASWPVGGFSLTFFTSGTVIESQHLRPSDSPDYRAVASRLREVQGLSITGTFRSEKGPFWYPGFGPDTLEIWCAADSLDLAADLDSAATRLWGPLVVAPGDSVVVDASRSSTLMGPGAGLLADRIQSGAGAWLYYVWHGYGTLFTTPDARITAQLVYR